MKLNSRVGSESDNNEIKIRSQSKVIDDIRNQIQENYKNLCNQL